MPATPSELQQQARALGDPTRHRIFELLVAADEPVDVADLTAELGLNHNAIRQHLAKLVAAGLVSKQQRPPVGRGRPRLCFSPVGPATQRWVGADPYQSLATLLSECVRTGDAPIEVGRRAGAALASDRSTAGAPLTQMLTLIERQGFAPRVIGPTSSAACDQDGHIEVDLDACPFASVAASDANTVCALHQGIAEGIAQTIGGVQVDHLAAHDPTVSPCRLTLRTQHH